MPPAAIIGAGLLVGGGLSYLGAKSQADAQEGAAKAQLSAMSGQQQMALGIAKPTDAELRARDEQLQNAETFSAYQVANLRNSEAILSSMSPAYVSLGQNVFQLLNGKEAPTLAPLRDQIDRQRSQLQTQLAQAYGPGWATSSAGIEAMQRFEQNAQSTMAGAQQNYLGTLLQGQAQGFGLANESANQGSGMAGNLFSQAQSSSNSLVQRQVSALQENSPVKYAGAPFVGQQVMGGWMNGMGNQIAGSAMQAGMSSAMSGSMGGGGGNGLTSGSAAGGSPGYGYSSTNYSDSSGFGTGYSRAAG